MDFFASVSLRRVRDVKLNCSSALTRMTYSVPQTFSSLASSCWKNLFSSPQPCTLNVTPTTRHHLNLIQPPVSHILPQLPFLTYPCHLFPTIWCFRLNGASEDISLQCPNHSGLLSVLFPSLSNFDFMFLYFRDHFVTTLNSFFFSSLPSPVITSKFLYFLQSTTPPNHPFAKQRLNFLLNRKSWRGLQLSNP